jgi:hypothetical protein
VPAYLAIFEAGLHLHLSASIRAIVIGEGCSSYRRILHISFPPLPALNPCGMRAFRHTDWLMERATAVFASFEIPGVALHGEPVDSGTS